MTSKTAKLSIPQRDNTTMDIDLPVYEGSEGPDVVDVAKLTAQGHFTFDPGFTSTASCESKITYIDGEKGILLHRGYPIEQLAEQSDYLETCYLLLNGELPNADQKREFVESRTTPWFTSRFERFLMAFDETLTPWPLCAGL